MTRKTSASGFTLLEMILALLIGVVLMYSVYGVLSQHVQQAQAGRQKLQDATIARSILTRMARDIYCVLGAANPVDASPLPGTDSTMPIIFNNGVYGTSNILVLTTTKVPRELNLTGTFGTGPIGDPTQQAYVCDLRRVSYWMVNGGQASPDPSSGLAWQELQQPTGNDLNTLPPDVSTYTILAPEVKDVTFQYFDGASWQDSWDGTTMVPTADGNSSLPMGPPSAIKITLTFFRRASDKTDLEDSALPKYQHVVAIPGGNNFPQTGS